MLWLGRELIDAKVRGILVLLTDLIMCTACVCEVFDPSICIESFLLFPALITLVTALSHDAS